MTVLSHYREYRHILMKLGKVVWLLTGNDEITLFEMKVMFCDGFQNSNAKFYRSLINRINFTSPSLLMCSHNRFSFVIISSKNNSFVTFGDSNDSYLVKGFWSPPLTVQDQWGFLFNRRIFAPSGMTICGTVCFPYLLSYCLFFSLI